MKPAILFLVAILVSCGPPSQDAEITRLRARIVELEAKNKSLQELTIHLLDNPSMTAGTVIYNTEENRLEQWDGEVWKPYSPQSAIDPAKAREVLDLHPVPSEPGVRDIPARESVYPETEAPYIPAHRQTYPEHPNRLKTIPSGEPYQSHK